MTPEASVQFEDPEGLSRFRNRVTSNACKIKKVVMLIMWDSEQIHRSEVMCFKVKLFKSLLLLFNFIYLFIFGHATRSHFSI